MYKPGVMPLLFHTSMYFIISIISIIIISIMMMMVSIKYTNNTNNTEYKSKPSMLLAKMFMMISALANYLEPMPEQKKNNKEKISR